MPAEICPSLCALSVKAAVTLQQAEYVSLIDSLVRAELLIDHLLFTVSNAGGQLERQGKDEVGRAVLDGRQKVSQGKPKRILQKLAEHVVKPVLWIEEVLTASWKALQNLLDTKKLYTQP